MRQASRLLFVVLIATIFPIRNSSASEIRGALLVEMGDYSDFSYKVPMTVYGLSGEFRNRNFILASRVDFSPTDKTAYGDIYQFSCDSLMLVHGDNDLLVVGGTVDVNRMTFRSYNESYISVRLGPTIGLANSHGRRVMFGYKFTGHDSRYDVQGLTFEVRMPVKRHLRLGFNGVRYDFHTRGSNPTHFPAAWLWSGTLEVVF